MTSQCSIANQQAFASSEQDIANEQEFAQLAKALSHPARVRILKILITLDNLGGCLNSDLVSELGLAQSTVSEHLRILKQAGFIIAEPNPPKVCYRVARDKIEQFQSLFVSILD
ncbi:winged helix-turn-helix transcriptional regulator [Vibrio sp. SCSIO 43135]|uniref:ArsR/SmtB family transcription factor n=1 Tax=Vibrio sp. SCSIO 43135 TaxID=2819096 RepID=UPI002075DC39|nr:winged helix-turn-helix domain-containing protein [Vibrio sp. SCSIO 43135]USD43855.1 winged helix-turn-helix transcriptional regulator [Vibrio sp. SCSIO 43135]